MNLGGLILNCFMSYVNCSIFPVLDIDECKVGSSTCTQNCENTEGSYTCSCDVGYTLADDGTTCIGNIHHDVHSIFVFSSQGLLSYKLYLAA